MSLLGVAVDAEDSERGLARWLRKHRPPYTLLPRDEALGASVQQRVRARLGGEAIPASLVLARDGTVLAATWGAPTVSQLRRLLALSQRSAASQVAAEVHGG